MNGWTGLQYKIKFCYGEYFLFYREVDPSFFTKLFRFAYNAQSKTEKLMTVEEVISIHEKEAELHMVCGGTVSSYQLKRCLWIKKNIDGLSEDQTKRLNTLIRKWRKSLELHNAQENKFHEYCVKTGNIKE